MLLDLSGSCWPSSVAPTRNEYSSLNRATETGLKKWSKLHFCIYQAVFSGARITAGSGVGNFGEPETWSHSIIMGAVMTDQPSWYAIHTHPKQEGRAESNLKAWNVETFYPRIRDCRFNEFTGEPSYFVKPLFPRYLFARFPLSSSLHKVRFTRGVHSIVCVGAIPATVDDQVIEIISSQIDEAGFVSIDADLKINTKVSIKAGPFKGLTGIFKRESNADDRVKILLDSVCFQAHVEVDRRHVRVMA